MKETIQDMAHQLFLDICEKDPLDIDVFFLDQFNFPKMEYEPRTTVYIPLPRVVEEMQLIQGNALLDTEESQKTIFSLFFASICHTAVHAKITDFEKYKIWMEGKDKKRAYETFEFIEDIRVNEFLKNKFPEYYSEIKKIEDLFNAIYEKKIVSSKEYAKKVFSEKFVHGANGQQEELREKIINMDLEDAEKFAQIADIIYNSPDIRNNEKLPFADHFNHPNKVKEWNKGITITPEGKFEELVEKMIDVWFNQRKQHSKVRKKYGKITEDLEFDKIDFAPENVGEYLRLKNSTHLFLKKMTATVKQTANAQEEGMMEDVGLLEMQAAIQSIAAQNTSMQIFEQDDQNRVEEEWAIVLDTSSSMKIKFDEMKKFAICLGEAANEVNKKSGKWGFFTFNNNFTIVKDHYEKYDQSSRSRIGGIEIQGLSFIADAVKLCTRIIEKDAIERKYIFLITDGQALGTLDADKNMQDAIENARKKGISVVGIGAPGGDTKIYSMSMPYEGLKKTIAKFLGAYRILAGDSM